MPALPPEFLRRPVAHRGLHGPGVPENSLAAFRAAVAAGYGIECDIQPDADGTPVVFHDDDLHRLTGRDGPIRACAADELARLRLLGSDQPVPTLRQMLDEVAGRAPLLIEIKDQDGALGADVGDLQDRVAEALQGYAGPVAVMSFNPETAARFHAAAPGIAVGLTTCGFHADDWPGTDAPTRARLAGIEDFARSGASFVSHQFRDLQNPAVQRLKAQGVPVLCWTIRSAQDEAVARLDADNITFEGYAPDL